MQKLPFFVCLLTASVSTVAYADDSSNPAAYADPTTSSTDASDETPERAWTSPVAAPKNAFEVGVDGGYTQPFGEISTSRNIHDSVNAGAGWGLTLGYRANPHWGVAAEGNFHASDADNSLGNGASAAGISAGARGTYHFMPYDLVDPYASLGAGYRLLWISPGAGPTELLHGFEAVKGIVGVDFRATRDVALGPLVGADVNVLPWRVVGDVTEDVTNPSANTFIYAGVGGRFDVGGSRVPKNKPVAYVPPIATPAGGPPEPRPVEQPAPPQEAPPVTTSVVNISPSIAAACKIEKPKAYFAFDSANLQGNDLSTLDAVAECFKSGPLKGRTMSVLGRTDPRGTDMYNLKLGVSRGQSVSNYLTDRGVEKQQVVLSTAGKIGASGVDEHGWAIDRRVDIDLLSP